MDGISLIVGVAIIFDAMRRRGALAFSVTYSGARYLGAPVWVPARMIPEKVLNRFLLAAGESASAATLLAMREEATHPFVNNEAMGARNLIIVTPPFLGGPTIQQDPRDHPVHEHVAEICRLAREHYNDYLAEQVRKSVATLTISG